MLLWEISLKESKNLEKIDNKLKVISYNIHKGFSVGNVKFLLDEIRSAIRLINADLVFLQEVCGEIDKKKARKFQSPTESQFEFLADSVWSHIAYGQNAVYKKGDHGNAVLSKFPIIFNENIDISTLQMSQRGILHTIIEYTEPSKKLKIPIHILCVHLGLLESERREQISKLCERIKTTIPDHEPLVLAGDFNDWRQKANDMLQKELGLKDAFKECHGSLAKTYPAWFPLLKLDRIYFRGLKVTAAESLTGSPWNRLSDHAALVVDFHLTNL